MVSTYKGLQLFNSRMVGCHLLSWRNLQKKIAFFRLFSRERSETCDTPKGIYFSELKNLGGGGVRDSPCAYASCIYFPCHYIFLINRTADDNDSDNDNLFCSGFKNFELRTWIDLNQVTSRYNGLGALINP